MDLSSCSFQTGTGEPNFNGKKVYQDKKTSNKSAYILAILLPFAWTKEEKRKFNTGTFFLNQ